MDDPEIPDGLADIEPRAWNGAVFRHMFADFPPDRENTRGARWNPPEVPAIYTSLERAVALAEADYHIGLQPIRPKAQRTIYRIAVTLHAVLDLTAPGLLVKLGVSPAELRSEDHCACRTLGRAVEWMGNDGMLIPSARAAGHNLVIFPHRTDGTYRFEVLSSEVIAASTLP